MESENPPKRTVRLRIEGMSCAGCSSGVESSLAAVAGVESVAVSLTLAEAQIKYDPALVSCEELAQVVKDAGFEAEAVEDPTDAGPEAGVATCALTLGGMSCTSCEAAVTAALLAVPGVQEATVSLSLSKARVKFDPDVCGPRPLIEAAEAAGFDAALAPRDARPGGADVQAREKRFWRRKLYLSLIFTVPLFIFDMILMYIPGPKHWLESTVGGVQIGAVISFCLATPVQFWIGWVFHGRALRTLRRGRANMDVLISIGTTTAYAYSLLSVAYQKGHPEYEGHGTFFETSALLITFVTLGKTLESAAKGRTSEALTALLDLAPPRALLCLTSGGAGSCERHSGEAEGDARDAQRASSDAAASYPTDASLSALGITGEKEVLAALLQRGDLVKVLPGAQVPVDGQVAAGRAYVDESMITGEPVPVSKAPGDEVLTGTVSSGGALWVRATRVGADSALARIVQLVESAQLSKAPIQAFADRVSAVFVPVVLLLAVIVWAAWFVPGIKGALPADWIPAGSTPLLFSLLFGIAVVVIACPCALGLATPTAVMVGTGVAARHGILIKSAEAMEKAARVTDVVFDKTGTLTEGKPSVTGWRLLRGDAARRRGERVESQCDAAGEADDTNEPLHAASWDPKTVLLLLACLESTSEHPLARALLRHAGLQLGLEESTEEAGNGQATNTAAQLAPQTPATPWLLDIRDAETVPGRGLQAWVACPRDQLPAPLRAAATGASLDVRVMSGNRAFFEEQGVAVDAETLGWMRVREGQGATCVLVALAGGLAGAFAITDPLRPEARGVVTALRRAGVVCHMVTGDNWVTARIVAQRLGITSVQAQVTPSGKVAAVRALQDKTLIIGEDEDEESEAEEDASGLPGSGAEQPRDATPRVPDRWLTRALQSVRLRPRQPIPSRTPPTSIRHKAVVAMVGDGVNDAAALVAADVGIAVGQGGTAVAIDAADIVLMRGSMHSVLVALHACGAIFRRIRLNYVWALGYNVLAIPVAAGALYPPLHFQLPAWVAGAAMAMSSVSVVCSSLLLRRYKPPREVTDDSAALSSARRRRARGRGGLGTGWSVAESQGSAAAAQLLPRSLPNCV
ncbi:hypothetical protein QBZ16_000771 [Prototheca wickerhamii]|uniref:HMA domain-containing protein n=1 Tax=Prototheca wickerhamii TaxID=3111 RepID=A0AAD9IPQ5_PROWI|nr:hypothetical protein QBZ16_000771 [Prototheca wickerhamii]